MASFIFLGTSNHPKSIITLNELNRLGYFSSNNCIVITNHNEGGLPTLAKELKYKVHVVKSDLDLYNYLQYLTFDYLISCGWHLRISSKVLKLPKKIAINSHSSFLPDYKGLGAYKHAWANAEKYSGNTIHIMDEDFDTGVILAQAKVKIKWFDTPRTLLIKIAKETPHLIIKAVNIYNDYNNKKVEEYENSKKGRYFLRTSNPQFIKHRLYNLFASALGLKKWLTKHK